MLTEINTVLYHHFMKANPSTEWTPEERLAIIAEHTNHAITERFFFRPEKMILVIEKTRFVAMMNQNFLEANRDFILTAD